jgi:adenosylmethionine-8-amino-7-oxononanoate aminotransferase
LNIGHGDRRVTDAIARQAERLAYISPFQPYEERALSSGRKLSSSRTRLTRAEADA